MDFVLLPQLLASYLKKTKERFSPLLILLVLWKRRNKTFCEKMMRLKLGSTGSFP